MAKLYFRYGAMNCGKSTSIIQVAHNYEERNMIVSLIKPSTDTKGDDSVISRVNISRKVDFLVFKDTNLLSYYSDLIKEKTQINCILVDEAQFLTSSHVDQLFKVATLLSIPVICYGLRTDFRTKAFEGSARLFELAHSLEEIKTICRCGKKAIFNARKVSDRFVDKGDQVAIEDNSKITYESLCGSCYLDKFKSIF